MGGFAPHVSLLPAPRTLRIVLASIAFFYLFNIPYTVLTVLLPILSTLQMITDNPRNNPVK